MNTFSQLDPLLRENLVRHINQRWGQLYSLEKDWGEKAIRYLLVTNAGGAIATLSFLGASDQAFNLTGAKVALVCFIIGVLFVGGSVAETYHRVSNLFKSYKNDVDRFFRNEISWEILTDEDSRRAVPTFWLYFLPYSSFAFFIGGCVAGAFALKSTVV